MHPMALWNWTLDHNELHFFPKHLEPKETNSKQKPSIDSFSKKNLLLDCSLPRGPLCYANEQPSNLTQEHILSTVIYFGPFNNWGRWKNTDLIP